MNIDEVVGARMCGQNWGRATTTVYITYNLQSCFIDRLRKCCCYETHVTHVLKMSQPPYLIRPYRLQHIFSESDNSFSGVHQNLAVDQDCHHGAHQSSAGEDKGHSGLGA